MAFIVPRFEGTVILLSAASKDEVDACPGAEDPEHMLQSHLGVCSVKMEAHDGRLTVNLRLHPEHINKIPASLKRRCTSEGIQLQPVLFQQGVNEMQTIGKAVFCTCFLWVVHRSL